MKSCSVEVRNIFKSYESENKNFVLNDLNLTVKIGEIFSLIGSSGCGKTTLLQCILGMKRIEKGSIKVFGDSIERVSHLIGFMPQQSQLVPELTIKETAQYFGNIFEMTRKDFESQFKKIFELLELPDYDQKIENLSGGERRRISLAIALIHDPKLLILDEPTVGLDPILRDKIWKFLKFSVATSDLSILITTHYISEAMQSDCVGFLRNGRILVEDRPKSIIEMFSVVTLDEALLKICEGDESDFKVIKRKTEDKENFIEQKDLSIVKRKKCTFKKFAALLMKEFIRVKRQPSELIFMLIFPIIHTIVLKYLIGDLPSSIKLGIVNHDHIQNISNTFLNEITNKIEIKFYESYNDAYEEARRGIIFGFLEITQHEENDESILVNAHLDHTNFHFYSFVRQQIYKAYKKISRGQSLIKFEEPFYASLNIRSKIVPSLIVQAVFGSSMTFTCFSIAQNRRDGFWNLTLLSGVSLLEILIAQIFITFTAILIMTTETILLIFSLIDLPMAGSFLSVIQLLAATSVAGTALGILLSFLTDDARIMGSFSMTFLQISSFLSGALWPIEGQFWLLKYFSFLLPTTLPSMALKDVMIRGFDFSNNLMKEGISILMLWTIASCTAGSYYVRRTKYF